MKRAVFSCLEVISAGLLVFALAALVTPAQRDPTSVQGRDPESVKEKKREAKINRPASVGGTRSTRPSLATVVILTEPADARIVINGKPAGAAKEGQFTTELRSGQYTIEVSAGSEYEASKKQVAVKAPKPLILEMPLLSKYALLKIFPRLENAKVLIDGQAVPPDKLQADNDLFVIDGLLPGEHKVVYSHPDYITEEKQFKFEPSVEYTWRIMLKRPAVELVVTTDPDTEVYLDGDYIGKTDSQGKLKNTDTRVGSHEIRLVKEGYEEYRVTRPFEYQKPVQVEHRLVSAETPDEFNDDFEVVNVKRWTMPPSGWTIESGRLVVANAPVLGFVNKIQYRNFVMNFNLRLINGGGAAWVVRVKDSNNYYLFYLSGPEGLFRNRFITYVVRDNKFDPRDYVQAVPIATELKSGGEYTVEITANNNRFEHKIIPAVTGRRENLGDFTMSESFFSIGAVGFRTVGPEKFSIDDLFVVPRPLTSDIRK